VKGGHCDYCGCGPENLATSLNVKVIYDWILLKVAPTQTYNNSNTLETGTMMDRLLSITSPVIFSNTSRHQSI